MKKILYIIILCACAMNAMAQEKEWNILKHTKDYYCGEGVGPTVADADNAALADLIKNISVSVTSSDEYRLGMTETKGTLNEQSQFKSSVDTYSSMTLTNSKRMVIGKEPNVKVGRYITVAEVEKMFQARADRARDMVLSAEKALKKGCIDDALRNYYWSLTMLRSLLNPNAIKYNMPTGEQRVMTNWVKEQIEDIIDEVKFECVSREGDDVDLDITYKGKPVNSIGFSYFDGRQRSSLVTAQDGYAKLEFIKGYSQSQYDIYVEYKFEKQAKTDKELEQVLGVVKGNEFQRSLKKIKGIKEQKKPKETAPAPAVVVSERPTWTKTAAAAVKMPEQVADKKIYYDVVTAVESAIKTKNATSVKQFFTPEGWDVYTRLIDYGQAKAVGVPNYKFYESGENVIARGLQLSFSFPKGTKKSFVEEVIFTFEKTGKINNVSFGLGRTAEADILGKGRWPENVRMEIMNFLENYKTAYALKRFDYIQSIFDEDAIIIVGNKIKKAGAGIDLGRGKMNNEEIKFIRYNKEQYMKSLKKCFDSQEFVNIHFSNNDVRKSNREGAGETYGIQLEQDYHSTTYGDHGYLFLLVDLNNPKQPLIKIRTWQPTKDANGRLYDIADF